MNNKRHDEHPGFLFVLEGIDGAGKTAVVESLVELLCRNYDVVRLREPTNESQWGLEIRERSPRVHSHQTNMNRFKNPCRSFVSWNNEGKKSVLAKRQVRYGASTSSILL